MSSLGNTGTVNLAIIGLGRWGQRLVNSVQGVSDAVRFTRGTTRTRSSASDFARDRDVILMPDLESVLACPEVDGVVLATPHSQHVDQVRLSVAAGKHVLCEKPLALTLAEGKAAFAAANEAGKLLCVGQNRRFLPSVQALAERTGYIGELLQISANFSWGAVSYDPGGWRAARQESPAGGMTGLGIHMIDLMIAFGLEPRNVSVLSRRTSAHGLDDVVTALIGAGPSVGILTTMMGPGRIFQFEVCGTTGRLAIDGEHRLLVQAAGMRDAVIDFDVVDIERWEIEAFASAITGSMAWPVTEGQALRALALFEAVCGAADPDASNPAFAQVEIN